MTTYHVQAIRQPYPRIVVNTVESRDTVYSFEHPGGTREALREYVADHVVLQVEPYKNTFPATDVGAAEAFSWHDANGGKQKLVGLALLPTPG